MGYLQKEGLQPNPETPKTILDRSSAYKLRTKTTELPKLRTLTIEPQHQAKEMDGCARLHHWIQEDGYHAADLIQ